MTQQEPASIDWARTVARPILADDGNWIVGYVVQDESGYLPTTYEFGPDDAGHRAAQTCAASINNDRGHSDEFVHDVAASSIAASRGVEW